MSHENEALHWLAAQLAWEARLASLRADADQARSQDAEHPVLAAVPAPLGDDVEPAAA